jgi:parvulin-like peptidyl-prolyl isomerase
MTLHAAASPARRRHLMLAALLVFTLLAGCSGRPTPVAKVGSEIISVEQFQDAARGNEAQYPGAPDSAKSALIDDLARRSLLVQEARRRHMIADSTLQRMRAQEAQRLAVDRLIELLVPKDTPVSDAEIAAFHKRRDVEAHITLIFVLSKRDADAAKAAVEQGEDFAAVANRYNPAGMLPPGGDLGFLPPGALLEPLDQHLFDSPLNQLLGPDEIKGQGWAVAKILERRPRKQEPLDAQKATLKPMIQQRKLRELQQKAFQGLKDQYRVRLEEGGGQAVFQRFNSAGGDTSSQGRVLARFDGKGGKSGVYTMSDALADLQDPTQQRPNFQNVAVIEHWIELQAVRRVSALEAERRHLEQDSKVKRRVEERVNNLLLERLYGDEVAAKVGTASLEDIKAAYERRASAFARLDAVKLRMLTVPDSAAAAALMVQAQGGTNPGLGTLAGMLPAKLKATAKVVEREIKYPTKDPMWSQLQGAFMGLQPGDVRGPMRTPAGWAFFEVVSKQQGTQSFEQLSPQIQHALEQEALELKRDHRLSAFTDSLRSTTKIEIYRDRLKTIPWPVPQANAAS